MQTTSQCYQISAIKQQHPDYRTRQGVRRGYFEQNRLLRKNKFYSEFLTLGPTSKNDNTSMIESRIQRRLLRLHKHGLLPTNLRELIRPTGSQPPRMYGLPKTHKKDVPLRPILSITGSAQLQMVKFLFLSNRFSPLLEQLHTGLFHLCGVGPLFFSALLIFRVYILMSF